MTEKVVFLQEIIMVRFCLFGSGRMGELFSNILVSNPDAELSAVINPNLTSAHKLVDKFGGRAFSSLEDCLEQITVDAAIICSPTNTHLEIISQVARAGIAMLCEKPIDLSLERVDECIKLVEQNQVPFAVGFNRRFDPTVAALKKRLDRGDLGRLNMLMLTSRDPAPPPLDYIRRSGGYFCDSTIHDIDLACWLTGESPVEVFAIASCLVDSEIGDVGDVDTAMTTLKMPSGTLCNINNSRRACYGFDQRIEAFGERGMLQTENQRDVQLKEFTGHVTDARPTLKYFFLERYAESFEAEVASFIDNYRLGQAPGPTAVDGRRALAIAQACEVSRKEGRSVPL